MMENNNPQTPELAPEQAPLPETPSGRPRPFPSAGDLLAMLGIALGAQVVVGLVVSLAGMLPGVELLDPDPAAAGRLLAVSYFAAMSVTLGGVLWYRHARGCDAPVADFSIRRLRPVLLCWALLLMLAVGVVLEPLLALIPEAPVPEGRGWWALLSLVVFAPVFEELLCRGIILGAVRRRWGVVAAWLLSSLFFGVLHLYPALVINAFALGLILGYIYIVTQSLWAPMLLHAANNAVAYLLIVAGPGDSVLLRDWVNSPLLYGAVYAVSLVAAAFSAWMVRRTLAGLREAEKNRPEA